MARLYDLHEWPENVRRAFASCVVFKRGVVALLLPWCTPVAKAKRIEERDAVRAALSRMAATKFVYHDEDICWRHVMRFRSSIVLIDLGALAELKDDADSWVDRAWQLLESRINDN